MTCQRLSCRLSDVSYAQGIKHTLERSVFRILKALQEALRRTVFPTVEGQQMLLSELIEISHIPYKTFVIQLVYGRVSCNDVHCLAAQEMHQLAFYLCRTSRLVGAECLCLLLVPHKRRPAVRTCLREVGKSDARLALGQLDTCDLRDDLSSLLHIDIISDMYVKELHLVGVVQRCTLDNRTAELHRLEVGHRSHCSCPSHLVVNA